MTVVLAPARLVLGSGSRLALFSDAAVVRTPTASGIATILSVTRPRTRRVPSWHRTGRLVFQLSRTACAEMIGNGRLAANVMTTSRAGSGPRLASTIVNVWRCPRSARVGPW
jgi:hypothetical protein